MLLSHRGTLWLDTVEERVHLAGVGVNMSIRNWRRDLMQRGLAEDNKEVRESGWEKIMERERERERGGDVFVCLMQMAMNVTQAEVSVLTTAHKVHMYIQHGHTFSICMYACTDVDAHLFVLRTYVCMSVVWCVYVCICMCMCMYVCVYLALVHAVW